MTDSKAALPAAALTALPDNLLADLDQHTAEVIKSVRKIVEDSRQQLVDHFHQGKPIKELVREGSQFIDQLLRQIWSHFLDDSADIALIAVGGYGRGELHPGSDVDILILLDEDKHDHHRPALEQFLVFLWDIGLEIGHSVRSLMECRDEASKDITIATNLMESRLLAGPERLFQSLSRETAADRIWPGAEFFSAKWQEQQQRYKKYNDTAYNLEPNVKEGPGGLRDIQMVGWVAKRHFGVNTLAELVDHDFLTEQEYNDLIAGQDFLWRVRFGLHCLAGRREDRLLFDYQKILAEELGYRQDRQKRLAVEQFMKDYYRTITELSRLNEMLLQLFQEAILYGDSPTVCTPINKRFHSCNDFIEVTGDHVFRRYPFALLEIFLLLEQHPELKGVRAATIRLIREYRHLINEDFRIDLRCRSLFMAIIREPRGVTRELRRMNRYGILAAYLPVFANIVGQMQYDLFHVYTVDDHTLMVLRNLRRFTVAEYAHEFPFCSDLIQRIPKVELLYLAALFHDIAKGRGGRHSELGAVDAAEFCKQHGLSQYDTDLVTWLVLNHLILSDTAQRKDISDPDVINHFASKIENQVRLDYLYLLTVADIRGTSPELWNNWKHALLLELYRSTRRVLRSGPDQATREAYISETQTAARALLTGIVDDQDIQALWDTLGDDYFLRHHADEVAWQTRSICHTSREQLPLVLVREETQRGATEIFIYTPDRKYLFAICTQVIEQIGLTIVDARIFTSQTGFALDTFIVLDASGDPIHDPRHIHEIESQLQQSLEQTELPPLKISRRTTRKLKHFRFSTDVDFEQDEDKQRTIMYLSTADKPGLLARVSRTMALHHIRVHTAKIATYGARVEDSFMITDDRNDRPLTDEAAQQALKDDIIKILDQDDD